MSDQPPMRKLGVVVTVLRPHWASETDLARLREAACEVAVDAGSALGRRHLRPGDIASIGARALCCAEKSADAKRTFLAEADRLRGRGLGIYARGLAQPEQLFRAMEAGAEFLQGSVLAPFALAGGVDALEPLPLDAG